MVGFSSSAILFGTGTFTAATQLGSKHCLSLLFTRAKENGQTWTNWLQIGLRSHFTLGPRGGCRHIGGTSAYKTFHKRQKTFRLPNAGCVETVPASLPPGHSRTAKVNNHECRESWYCLMFHVSVRCLEAAWGATELQVPIKPFIEHKKEASSCFLGAWEQIRCR